LIEKETDTLQQQGNQLLQQAICQPLITEAQIQSWASPCVIDGG
jgi:hypothetical protein